MKPCLDDHELLHLWTAEADELPDQRAHLAGCQRCTASYEEVSRDAGLITAALTTAADSLRGRDRARVPGFFARIGEGARVATIFSGAAALGGVAAFVLMLALGWHPSNSTVNGNGNAAVANVATGAVHASPANQAETADLNSGSLYAADAFAPDPLTGLAYGDAPQAANSNAGGDLLFCVSEDDALCS
jgi:hypothetical protein